MRILLAMVLLAYIAGLPTRIDAENASEKVDVTAPAQDAMNLIEEFARKQDTLREERLPIYREELKTGSSARQRLVAATALGIYYLDRMHLRVALQYFAIARALSENKRDTLTAVIDLGLAKIRHAYGDYTSAAEITREVLETSLSRERFDQASYIHISSLHSLDRTTEAVRAYKEYAKLRTKKTGKPEILKVAAVALRSSGDIEAEQEVLESLAEQYPLNSESIWAFNLLKQDSCRDAQGKQRYYFSEDLLRKLSINRRLDSGLPAFLVAKTKEPLRDRRGRLSTLSFLDQADLILKMNLTLEAKSFENDLREITKNGTTKDRSEALELLARLYASENRYDDAAKYYNQFLALFPEHRRRHAVRASLAYTLHKIGSYEGAADNFRLLTKISRSSVYRWEYFWNTYLSGQLNQALELLDKPGFIKPKDPQEPLALVYWRARIHERLGSKDEADRYYQAILKKDATSFYANLVLAKHPEYWQKMLPDSLRKQAATVEKTEMVQLAAMRFDPNFLSSKPQPDGLQVLQELIGAGLEREAKLQLQNLQPDAFEDHQRTEMESLAYYLADYRSYRRLAGGRVNIANHPTNFSGLIDHTKEYNTTWQANYPLAFDGILDEVSGRFNVSKFLLLSLMRAESSYDVFAQSWVGARGLMQIMPKTAIKISEIVGNGSFHVDMLYDPSVNLTYGAYYIGWLLDLFKANPFVAIASYNAGPIAVNDWLRRCKSCEVDEFVESIPYRETRRYVKSVIKYYGQYSRIYRFDQPFWAIPDLPGELPNEDQLF